MKAFAVRLAITGSCVLMLVATAVRADEQIDNPQYKQWSNFKPGSWVKYKTTSEAAGQQSTMEMTTKLLELTPDKAVVERTTSMVAGGQKMDMPAQKQEIPAKIDKPVVKLSDVKPDVKEGQDDVSVSGKTYKCKTSETTTKNGDNTTWSKTWMCDEVPTGLVKMESMNEGQFKSSNVMELIGFEVVK
jgi:hypothetical protein